MTRLDELFELAEAARRRTPHEALQAVHDRLAIDDRLERELAAARATAAELDPELVARAQVVELDPVELRNLVEAAAALIAAGKRQAAREVVTRELPPSAAMPRGGRELVDAGDPELVLAAEVAAARFTS